MSAFENRLAKNARHWSKWARRRGLEAFRIYDLDIPDYPFAIDAYLDRIHVMEYPRRSALRDGTAQSQRAEVVAAIESSNSSNPEFSVNCSYVRTRKASPRSRRGHGELPTRGMPCGASTTHAPGAAAESSSSMCCVQANTTCAAAAFAAGVGSMGWHSTT